MGSAFTAECTKIARFSAAAANAKEDAGEFICLSIGKVGAKQMLGFHLQSGLTSPPILEKMFQTL